ncbi:hypothetical protein MTR_4g028540 [Medicago truncatula]|uniref:Uncharacterized protein n=1 Tax=Medicago truncatula TaxID=3880 RepID=G7JJH1_MEDTR|nr:hypothetical protein MTR_4g028540 [Medicago truncatula]
MVYRHRCRVGLLRQKLECEPNSCQSSPPPTSTRAGDRLGVEDWQQGGGVPQLSLSKYFYLPALRTLHLEYFYFAATNSHCADPFSNCLVLNTLVLGYCCLIKETQLFYRLGPHAIFLFLNKIWLQVLANVKILKLNNSVIRKILHDLRSNAISKEDKPPSFLRLESLKVVKPLLLQF